MISVDQEVPDLIQDVISGKIDECVIGVHTYDQPHQTDIQLIKSKLQKRYPMINIADAVGHDGLPVFKITLREQSPSKSKDSLWNTLLAAFRGTRRSS